MRVAVIGAGPAGLTAAHRLRRGGAEVIVMERETAAGGRTKTGDDIALEQEKRFQAMRARLLGQDARVD